MNKGENMQMIEKLRTVEKDQYATNTAELTDAGDGASLSVSAKVTNPFGPQMETAASVLISPENLREWANTFAALADKYEAEM